MYTSVLRIIGYWSSQCKMRVLVVVEFFFPFVLTVDVFNIKRLRVGRGASPTHVHGGQGPRFPVVSGPQTELFFNMCLLCEFGVV